MQDALLSKHRWRQYRLRTLLAFTLLCSVGLSWLAVKIRQAERQRKAVKTIQLRGGTIAWIDHTPPGFQWLQKPLGRELFRTIAMVDLHDTDFTDDDLRHLRELPDMNWLSLNRTRVTDAGLVHVKGLKQLELFALAQTRVTDVGLKNFDGLTQLVQLTLCETQVTDAGLEHLKALRQLKELSVENTQVTTEGAQRFRRSCPNCRVSFEKAPQRP
jgi:hypothetical protein